MLKINNKVCFEIEYSTEIVKHEIPCNWGERYRSVIGYGTVDFITDFDKKKEALNIIMAHYGKDDNVYQDEQVKSIVILKLTIDEITGKQKGDWD